MRHIHDTIHHCPVTATISLIGGKYKPVILWYLTKGTTRYGELKRYIDNATPKMLTQQLRELEKDKLIVRKVYPVVPPKVEYSLTTFGETISNVMKEMYKWGKNYLTKQGIHVDCEMYKGVK
ncbi:MAG: helix-turn-helix transcriptional regulator [Mycoplasmataceae bacterium]|jgi:DNA-binding HxlR family transcriptional regulator|nr:helix-turn-helix transcriptional regulator [Mycoplasmataceae bacterium]